MDIHNRLVYGFEIWWKEVSCGICKGKEKYFSPNNHPNHITLVVHIDDDCGTHHCENCTMQSICVCILDI
uniref:Uncharacterized protein n=1 Tax=Salix viminalis TaxID=40686 RepID=A0A6N2LMB3_SALVM